MNTKQPGNPDTPNRGRKDQIAGVDVVTWMQQRGLVVSSMAPAPQRLRHLGVWFERAEFGEEEHF
jgi:hypothetical protein